MNSFKELSMWNGFKKMLYRDLLHSTKNLSQLMNPLLLFILISASFPFAINIDENQLTIIGPGVIWIIAILSFLLTLNNLYKDDMEDGSLDYMLLSAQPLPVLTFAKILAHWVLSGLPLVILCPFVSVFYQLSIDVSMLLSLTLLIGTLALSLIGSIGASLTISSQNNTTLLSLLVLPITIPILIFGAKTVVLYQNGHTSLTGLYLIGAYCMFALSFSPFVSAASLRIGSN